jgi:hypothetical protein
VGENKMSKDKQENKFSQQDLALMEMQQHILNLTVRIGCLEELLVGTTINEQDYKDKVKEATSKVELIIKDKFEELISKTNEEDKKE